MRGCLSVLLALSVIGCTDSNAPPGVTDASLADVTVLDADSGLRDARDNDAAPADSGPPDVGALDTGVEPDGGDAGQSDAADLDLGTTDGPTADSGLSDPGDAATLDSGPPDVGAVDTGHEPVADDGGDAAASDAAPTDSGAADSGVADAGTLDDCQRAFGVSCAVFEEGYLKASNTGDDEFGFSVALSSDGNTLAIGAPRERSSATGVNGNQADDSTFESGAVYVFARSGTTWGQQAYLKASNTDVQDLFGLAVALSDDGDTLAVGALGESSSATGVDGNQADNSAFNSGAVYVIARNGTTWSQQAYVKASNTGRADHFGEAVALSGDGNTLAVGAWRERSNATGVNGNQADNSAQDSGAVYVFTRSGPSWSQHAYLKASNTGVGDHFGAEVALSGDGNTLAVGALGERSNTTGVNGDQANDAAGSSGAVYMFARGGTGWSQEAYLKATNTGAGDRFGTSVALSEDGNTLAVGAPQEASSATGINGNQADNSAVGSGAVYVFTRSSTTWSPEAYLKATNTGAGDRFGYSVALSSDGHSLVVGAYLEESAATGLGGNQADNSAQDSGAAYVFARNGVAWRPGAYLKASNTDAGDSFGLSVALSGDAATLAVGAYWEGSAATGVNGNQVDNSAPRSGAVYVRRIAP